MNYRASITGLLILLLAVPLWAADTPAPAPKRAATVKDIKLPPAVPTASQPASALVSGITASDVGIGKLDDGYIIGPGDLLEISVWKDEALTKSAVVLPDGRISFPLIGEVIAGNRLLSQVKQEIEKRIARYVPDAIVSVDIRQVNSMFVYVIGRVNIPGRLVLNSNINVLQALATAGGLNPFAKRSSIKIFRHDGPNTKILAFDYDDVADGKKLEQNVTLKRGDVIVVP